jgi:ABC-type polysaccharide/polyol phosphate export permease
MKKNNNDIEIVKILLKNHLKIKYKRTSLGLFWSFLNPLITVFFISLVWSVLLGVDLKEYILLLFPAYISWTFFSNVVSGSCGTILGNEGLIKKVPINIKIFVKLNIGIGLVDLVISFTFLTILAQLFSNFEIGYPNIKFIIGIFLLIIASYSISLFLSIFSVYYRDTAYLIGVALQILFFVTPVLYTKNMIYEKNIKYIQFIIEYNPLTLVLSLIREGYVGKNNIDVSNFLYVIILICIFLIFGIYYFNKNRYKIINYL